MTLAGDRGGAATRCTGEPARRPALRGGDARGGSPSTLDFPDGHRRVQQWDELGRLTSRCYEHPGVAPTRCYTAQYDEVGNPIVLDDPETTSTITYDLLDRVTEVRTTIKATSAVEVEAYAYNALGGFSTYDSAPVDHQRPRLDGNGSASAGVPATHGGQPVDLSGGGRITRLGDSLLEYNRRGRLARVVQPGLTEAYGYDALQRRVAKTPTISGVSDTTFFYQHEPDRAQLDVQTSATTTSVPTTNVAATYVSFVGQPVESFPRQVFAYDGVDHPLWAFNAFLHDYFYELDTLGNVRRLRGHINRTGDGPMPLSSDLGGYRYSAFGKLKPPDAGTPLPTALYEEQPLRWQGRWWNETAGNIVASGTYDFRARTWSPQLGSFLQADELGFLTATGTLWSWPGQNPTGLRDRTGRVPQAVAGAVIGASINLVAFVATAPLSEVESARGIAGAIVGGAVAGVTAATVNPASLLGASTVLGGGAAGVGLDDILAGRSVSMEGLVLGAAGNAFGAGVGVGLAKNSLQLVKGGGVVLSEGGVVTSGNVSALANRLTGKATALRAIPSQTAIVGGQNVLRSAAETPCP